MKEIRDIQLTDKHFFQATVEKQKRELEKLKALNHYIVIIYFYLIFLIIKRKRFQNSFPVILKLNSC